MTNEQQIIFENNEITYKVLFLQSQQVGKRIAALSGGSGFRSAMSPEGSHASLHPQFFAPEKTLRVSPYRAQKTVVYRRNVMRQFCIKSRMIPIKA